MSGANQTQSRSGVDIGPGVGLASTVGDGDGGPLCCTFRLGLGEIVGMAVGPAPMPQPDRATTVPAFSSDRSRISRATVVSEWVQNWAVGPRSRTVAS